MGLDGYKGKPIVEITEHWRSPLGASAAIEAIAGSFAKSRAKVEIDGGAVRIRAGSNWFYRILGNLLSGEKVLPVALEVTATAIDDGCKLQARAFDTFGWRLTDRTFFGAEQSFMNRLEDLLKSAATAGHVVNRRIGAD